MPSSFDIIKTVKLQHAFVLGNYNTYNKVSGALVLGDTWPPIHHRLNLDSFTPQEARAYTQIFIYGAPDTIS